MTIETTSNFITYQGNGATTIWSYAFPIPLASYVYVFLTNNTTGAITVIPSSAYSITGLGTPGGGNLTYPLAGTPLAAGNSITIERIVPLTQETELTNQGPFLADTIEDEFDNLVMIDQQQESVLDRTLTVPFGEDGLQIPSATDRANAFLAFDANGDAIATTGTLPDVPISVYMESFLTQGNRNAATAFLQVDPITATGSTAPRTLADRFADCCNIKDFMTPSQLASPAGVDCSSALTAALLLDKPIYFPSGVSYRFDGAFTVDGNNVGFFSDPGLRSAVLYFNYVGTAITLGNGVTRTNEYQFENLLMIGVVGQLLFLTRYVRGVHFVNCDIYADGFSDIGLSTDYVSDVDPRFTYIFELRDCEMHQLATPTKHYMRVRNFAGQFEYYNTFTEGQYEPFIDGFNSSGNVYVRMDDCIVIGGYFSRFRDAWSFEDARVVNLKIGLHQSEGNLRNGVRLYTTIATTKTVDRVGCGEVAIIGCKIDSSADNAIYIRNERTLTDMASIQVTDLRSQLIVKTPVVVQAGLGPITGVTIVGVAPESYVPVATQDVVLISGGSAITTIKDVIVDHIGGRAVGTALRSAVRLEGIVSNVSIGAVVSTVNAALRVDNSVNAASTLIFIAPNRFMTATFTYDFGTVNANTGTSHDFTMAGVKAGDGVIFNLSTADPGDVVYRAVCSADNTISVRCLNITTGNIAVGSRSYRAVIPGY